MEEGNVVLADARVLPAGCQAAVDAVGGDPLEGLQTGGVAEASFEIGQDRRGGQGQGGLGGIGDGLQARRGAIEPGGEGRDGDDAGVGAGEEAGDVIEAGGVEQESPVAPFSHGLELGGDGPGPPVQLGVGAAQLGPLAVHHEGVGVVVGLLPAR